jgi:hypothetical protein
MPFANTDFLRRYRQRFLFLINYLRRPNLEMICRYRLMSLFLTYLSKDERFPTIFSRPRREEWSFLCTLRCSVSSLIRLVRIATWTSGEPVSLSLFLYSVMTFCFFSFVNIPTILPFKLSLHGPYCPLLHFFHFSRGHIIQFEKSFSILILYHISD